jgi:hypothetical protein
MTCKCVFEAVVSAAGVSVTVTIDEDIADSYIILRNVHLFNNEYDVLMF